MSTPVEMTPTRTGSSRQGPTGPPTTLRAPFHVLAKPTGPICNLDCEYCFFLSKESLYPGDRFRMSDDVLADYIGQYLASQPDGEVTVAWQGGEPTLMGVDFFRRAVVLADELARPGQQLQHTIQTNGTLLTDEWCELLARHRFLVGISIDGPPDLHDRYRVDKRGGPTSAKVLRGLALLQGHGVDVNVLCTVHAANQARPLDVYRYFRDDLGITFIQFIPIVERENETGFQEGDTVTDRSVDPAAWGDFLDAVFDEWVVRDVGTVFVQMFDAALASWCDLPSSLCIFRKTCGDAVALEHNGDLYSCDHFVEPVHFLGNIATTSMVDLVTSPQQVAFGKAKEDTLPGLLPVLRGAVRLQRRVPAEPVHPGPRRRVRPQLPVRRVQVVLHPHRRPDAADGPTAAERPLRRRGPRSLRFGRAQRSVPVWQRAQGQGLPPDLSRSGTEPATGPEVVRVVRRRRSRAGARRPG